MSDVLAYCFPREKRRLLKHHAAIRPGPTDSHAVHQSGPFAERLEPGDHIHHRRLAASRWPDDANKLAWLDDRRHAINSQKGVFTLAEGDAGLLKDDPCAGAGARGDRRLGNMLTIHHDHQTRRRAATENALSAAAEITPSITSPPSIWPICRFC